jgi:hypothetical protein
LIADGVAERLSGAEVSPQQQTLPQTIRLFGFVGQVDPASLADDIATIAARAIQTRRLYERMRSMDVLQTNRPECILYSALTPGKLRS